MAQHGYLGDDYGTGYDPNYDDDRERGGRGDRDWRDDRGRGFMFDERGGGRSWGDDERHDRDRSESNEWFGGGRGDWERAPRSFRSHPDDHYRSWRDRQMQALDRDYEDYCREREQQFHQDFDSWRRNRQSQGSQGVQQSERSSSEPMNLDTPVSTGGEVHGASTSAIGAATLGTNNSENDASAPTSTGRGRR